MHTKIYLLASVTARCLQLAQEYLMLPDRLHRWCKSVVACVIVMLIGCFITYAVVEKHHIENSIFYGHVQFSFVDGGYAEIFGYVLELAASALFFLYARQHHKPYWNMWALILLVVFLDDAFQLHESIGHAVSTRIGVSTSVGDLIGFASTGLLSAVFWVIGVRMITDQDEFCAYLVFTAYFSILIFFGVGVDAVHGMFGQNMSETLFALVEDGGELLMTALISLSALGMWRQQQSAVARHSSIASMLVKP